MTPELLRRIVFHLDGLRYSLAMAEVASKRLNQSLAVIEAKLELAEPYESEVVSSLLDAWSIVDMCNRIRDLVQSTPSLSPKHPSIQVFIRATTKVDELRNYVQHLQSEIPQIPSQSYPLWGSISWVSASNSRKCFTIVAGSLLTGVNAPGCSWDTVDKRFSSHLELFAHTLNVDLILIAEKLRALKAHLKTWVEAQPFLQRKTDQPTVFISEF